MHPVESPQPEPEGVPSTAISKHSRISRVDRFYDVRTLSIKCRPTHSNKATEAKPVKKKTVLRVIRQIDSRGRYLSTVVEIKSDQLFQTLSDLQEGTDWWIQSRVPPTVVPKIFYLSSPGLIERLQQERAKTHPDETLISDLEVALQFINQDYANIIQEVETQTNEGRISFDLLWALLRPNSLVFRRDPLLEQDQILLVRTLSYGTSQEGRYAVVNCDVIRDDGESFGLVHERINIVEFTGLRQIRDLDVYPLLEHRDHVEITDTAIKRARRFLPVRQALFETQGLAIREKANTSFQTKLEKFFTHGRVMIDPAAFRLYNTDCHYNGSVHTHLDRDALTDEQCAIFSPILLGFCFGSKTWGGFAAGRLVDISWSEKTFNSLVLGSKQKELVLALTRQHIARNRTFDDIIPGKGHGLVGLLCGGPGCGKTLTAEATAEYTHSPLYAVSAGELGTEPEQVDLRLARALELAQRWHAVLLLDEAEVFLQARTGVRDLARNALVSIFLRQLEYYQGILILTTNLITQIDAAFESRIHFCIHYPDLGMEARLEIWSMFFRRVPDEKGMKVITMEDLNKLSALEMNGRQIKNAVSNAQSIALEEKVPLSVEHVNKVLEIASDWNVAMRQAQRYEDLGPTQAQKQETHSLIQATRTYYLSDYGILTVVLSFLTVVFGFSIARIT